MSDKSLKVTDRRMFTPDGELREEFRQLEEKSSGGAGEESPAEPARRPELPPRPVEPPPRQTGSRQTGPLAGEKPARADGPGFMDLIGLLAEPVSIYLREAQAAGPAAGAQSLEMARLHIDLLMVLQDKTEGNLSFEEKAMLEDVVSRLRSGYVGLRG
ncbi:MAG: DUF1844 domain-containing protein [bacterium]|nr:DUF1844 domain-containing protein [bacterium]